MKKVVNLYCFHATRSSYGFGCLSTQTRSSPPTEEPVVEEPVVEEPVVEEPVEEAVEEPVEEEPARLVCEEPIKIGLISDITGLLQSYGDWMVRSFMLGMEYALALPAVQAKNSSSLMPRKMFSKSTIAKSLSTCAMMPAIPN